MGVFSGITTSWISNQSGLLGKRYVNYYNDAVAFFSSAALHGDINLTTQISSFTSSANTYSWMWLGYFLAPTTGTYTFYTSSDDASHLWVGPNALSGYTTGNSTVNNGGLHGDVEVSGTTTLTANTYNPIRIMFGENNGGDVMKVSFAGPSIIKTTNGSGYYYGGRDILFTDNRLFT
jgi:hypothetical protein